MPKTKTKVKVPPIKSQGIKTKLVPWISRVAPDFQGRWIEPFMGTGVVAFNLATRALLCDINPHLVRFYQAIQDGTITPQIARDYLTQEGAVLSEKGKDYYYLVRERFNTNHDPLDFLFLNRAGFNGMVRFNKKGQLNTPFCHQPNRFSKAHITKITNQIDRIVQSLAMGDFSFKCQSFEETIEQAQPDDLIYCDPPYLGLHTNYYTVWDEESQTRLYELLKATKSKFILSAWYRIANRKNVHLPIWRKDFHVLTYKHFYYVGNKQEYRHKVVEAIVTNYDPKEKR